MDRRAALPARAQLLHAAARPGSAKARHLYRLGAAWRARRAHRRNPVRAAGRLRDPGIEPALRARSRYLGGGRRVVRHQGGGVGHRGGGTDPHRQAGAEDLRAARCGGSRLRRNFLPVTAVSANRAGRRGDGLRGRAIRAGTAGARRQGTGRSSGHRGPLAAVFPRVGDRRGRMVGAGRIGCDRVRPAPCSGRYRRLLLETCGSELRRRLCAARLYGAGSRADLRLDDRAGNGGRSWPGGNHAGTAYSGDSIRWLPRRLSRACPVFAGNGRRDRRRDNDMGDVRAVNAVDLRRGTLHRAVARQSPAVRSARRHNRGGGRRGA